MPTSADILYHLTIFQNLCSLAHSVSRLTDGHYTDDATLPLVLADGTHED